MKKFVAIYKFAAIMYSYLTDNDNVDKKTKGSENCVIKRERKFQDYKLCLENN